MNDKKLIEWAEFVATKFSKNAEGWVYSRDKAGLKHIRYESDYTGYNHWKKRFRRALRAWSPTGTLDTMFRDQKKTLKGYFVRGCAYSKVALLKDDNLPDGQVNGIITHWEEDGEYIALFQPRVGVKVLEFIKSDPSNKYARAILDEMHTCAEMSWPTKEDESD